MVATLASSALLAACSDDAPSSRNSARPTERPAPHRVEWLDVGTKITPAQWIVSRNADTLRPKDDAEVRKVAERLDDAHAVYRESERMIANRAVQLSDMLGSLGIEESAPQVLDDLTRLANDVSMTEGFGAVTQHYYNLRAADMPRADALATLKSRYGGKRL